MDEFCATNALLYQNLPKVTTKIKQRRIRLAGHCIRHTEEMAHNLVLWEPTEGKRKRGKPKTLYIDTLSTAGRLCSQHIRAENGHAGERWMASDC